MKHLIRNNEITKSGLPNRFKRPNGELFFGGYKNRTDIHDEDGWRDEVIPEYDPLTHSLGARYYDVELDIVTFHINTIPVDTNTLVECKAKLKKELSRNMDRFVVIITKCKILYGDNNTELNTAIESTKQMQIQTIAAINAFTDVKVARAFQIRPEDVAYYKSLFEPYKF